MRGTGTHCLVRFLRIKRAEQLLVPNKINVFFFFAHLNILLFTVRVKKERKAGTMKFTSIAARYIIHFGNQNNPLICFSTDFFLLTEAIL